MDNKQALDFFKKLVEKDSSKGVEKYGHDTTHIDADLIIKYSNSNSLILDFGSGTGLILKKIEPSVGKIDAVEPLIELSSHIISSEKIKVINENIFDFATSSKYDLITLFGFMHYFNEDEANIIYEKCLGWLCDGGRIIVKNQFGVIEDVTVSGFSKELNMPYHAQYRYIKKEISILESKGFILQEIVDIYPSECNRWENTHFYAIIAKK